MKNTGKLASLLLAMVMLLAMSAPALAEESYSITIENGAEGHIYEAYQIFRGVLSDGVLSDVEWGSGINADYTDGTGDTTDDKFYTISDVQADQTITPAWTALKKYTIVYSVVDTNGDEPGGKNGTLSASASRKDMAPFAVYAFDEVY